MAGLDGLWIVRVSEGTRSLSGFKSLDARKDEAGNYLLDDPEYGTVRFLADGSVEAEGRMLRPREWTVSGEVTEFGRADAAHGQASAAAR